MAVVCVDCLQVGIMSPIIMLLSKGVEKRPNRLPLAVMLLSVSVLRQVGQFWLLSWCSCCMLTPVPQTFFCGIVHPVFVCPGVSEVSRACAEWLDVLGVWARTGGVNK